jgi:hypothetical protein
MKSAPDPDLSTALSNFFVIAKKLASFFICTTAFSVLVFLLASLKINRCAGTDTVWTVDFETQVCQLYCLFLPMLRKKKSEESAAALWCFKVCSPYSIFYGHFTCIVFY